MAINSLFRPSTVADEEGIGQLARRAFGDSIDQLFIAPDLLRWKYWLPRADFPGPRSYVMQREQRIVAHVGLWPVMAGNERGVHMIDWMADTDAPGAGVVLLSKLTRMFDFVYTIGGSSLTQRILPKFGFKFLGDACTWARPIRPFRQMINHQYRDWQFPARFARNLWWSQFPNHPKSNDWRVVSADTGWLLERNEEFFRYLRACPATTCRTFQLQSAERQEGFLALISAQKQARIAGIWLREPSTEHMQIALALAQEAALIHTDACEIVTRGLPELIRIAAHNAGMRLRNKEPIMVFRSRRAAGDLRLGFQIVDNDAIFLSDKVPRFLT